MTYDPFNRGEFPVGVRTIELMNVDGNTSAMTTEIWYPATEAYRGQDLDAATHDRFKIVDVLPEMTQNAVRDAETCDGRRPLVMYFHGGYGHRRELSDMCTYLASHGFVVASIDFPGDNVSHMYSDDPLVKSKPIDESAIARPSQAKAAIDRITSGRYEFLNGIIDPGAIGTFGMSMGGYTSLALNSVDGRQKASVAFAPLCGTNGPVPQVRRLSTLLRVDDWKGTVSTFVVAGGADAIVMVDDVRELHTRLPTPKRMAVLKLAGHVHWADSAELIHETMRTSYLSPDFPDPELDGPAMGKAFRPFSELCPASHAVDTMRAVALAQFENCLKGSNEAAVFLNNDLARVLHDREIDVEVTP